MIALWAVYVPGPDEYLAMPSAEVASVMAAHHNAAMAGNAGVAKMMAELGLSADQLSAVACLWPYSADDHADDLLLSYPSGWPA